ncbi:MAG TPA: cell division protein FtsB [Rhodanobacteraceae bacterium]
MLKWIALVLIALLIGLQVKLWVGEGGMHDLQAIRARVAAQQAQNVQLKQRNQALHADVEDLKHGQDAVEARARQQLGLVKPGEVFYQVVNAPAGAASTAAPAATTAVPAAVPAPAPAAPASSR